MQQFKEFRSRRLILKRASCSELDNYSNCLVSHTRKIQDKLNILNSADIGYITIADENGKMLGLIQINEIDENVASVKISIPNEAWEERYGKEAVHQFIKCCEERKLYRRVYFKSDNNIVRKYAEERPKKLNKNFYFDIV